MSKIKKTAWVGLAGVALFWTGTVFFWVESNESRAYYNDSWSYFYYLSYHAETLWINYLFFSGLFAVLSIGIYWGSKGLYKAIAYRLEESKTNREHKALLKTKQLFNEGILTEAEYEERLARIKAR